MASSNKRPRAEGSAPEGAPREGVRPQAPSRVLSAPALLNNGGLEAYTSQMRQWWPHPSGDVGAQPKKRSEVLVPLVRTLSLHNDHDWASCVPLGLRLAAGRVAGKGVKKVLTRSDPESLVRLRALLSRALTGMLSAEERDAACDALWLADDAPPSTSAADPHEAEAASSTSLPMKEVMGPLLAEVSAGCDAPLARARAAEQLLTDFGADVDASALLSLRCLVLYAYVTAGDASGATRWASRMHRDWIPLPLREAYDELLSRAEDGSGDGADAAADGDGDGSGGSDAWRGGGGMQPLPAHLAEAGRLAVDGWSSSTFHRGRGRHGAVLVDARGATVLGCGCNAAEVPHEGGKGGGKGGKKGGADAVSGGHHGKFVVHAEMAAVRAALTSSGGDLNAVRGACVYVARLASQGEHYEDGTPCEECEAVLRACGVARADYTTASGEVRSLELGGGGESTSSSASLPAALSDAHCKWMGVPSGWAQCKS